MMHYYGSPKLKTHRARWMMNELDRPFEYHIVDLDDNATRKSPFIDLNPAAKIPFLVDGDFKLGESMAINMYLGQKYLPELWSDDALELAQIYHWSFWAISNLQPEALGYSLAAKDPARAEAARAHKAEAQWHIDNLETMLTSDYLVGDRCTIADMNCGSTVRLAWRVEAAVLGPNVSAWMNRLAARPGYKKTYGDESYG